MLGIMAGLYKMDCSTFVVVYGSGMCYAGLAGYVRYTSHYVPFWRRQAQDALHHGRHGPEAQYFSCARRQPLQWQCWTFFFW